VSTANGSVFRSVVRCEVPYRFSRDEDDDDGEDSKKTMTLGCFESDLESLHLFDFQISSSHVVAVENPGSPFRGCFGFVYVEWGYRDVMKTFAFSDLKKPNPKPTTS